MTIHINNKINNLCMSLKSLLCFLSLYFFLLPFCFFRQIYFKLGNFNTIYHSSDFGHLSLFNSQDKYKLIKHAEWIIWLLTYAPIDQCPTVFPLSSPIVENHCQALVCIFPLRNPSTTIVILLILIYYQEPLILSINLL